MGKIAAAAILVPSSLACAIWNCHAQGRRKGVMHIDCYKRKVGSFSGSGKRSFILIKEAQRTRR